jgi:hypothetical protein
LGGETGLSSLRLVSKLEVKVWKLEETGYTPAGITFSVNV